MSVSARLSLLPCASMVSGIITFSSFPALRIAFDSTAYPSFDPRTLESEGMSMRIDVRS